MQRGFRIATCGALALIASAAPASSAGGDGLPVPFDGTQTGVTVPGGESRYTTVFARRETVVLRTSIDGGEVERSRVLRGTFTVPAVAYDGSPSGLSADEGTLVLIRPRTAFPRSRTTLAVLNPQRLQIQRKITLDGDFSFDALSPDGETMYLIEYLDPRDPTAYQVRAYDLERERLVAEPIVDPDVAPVTMGGAPQTRVMSPDGRWAYTLYDSLDRDRPPFIHALDTETGTAACIVLEDGLLNRNLLGRMKLDPSPDGSTLAVAYRGDPVVLVDTATFEVTEPPVDPEPGAGEPGGSGGRLWIAGGVAALAIVILAGAIIRRRRRASATDPSELERLVDLDSGEPASGEPAQREEDSRDCDPVP